MLKDDLEQKIEQDFLNKLLSQNQEVSNPAIKAYQNLVFMRYYEVIKNSFPLFIQVVETKKFEDSIKAFMKNTPSTTFVWQIANDYRKFVKKNNLFGDKKYFYELLYYDWIEIEIYMKEYKDKEISSFSWLKNYKLAKSARVKKYRYDIINKNYEQKRENFLIIYYDFRSHDVIYREINPIIYFLLKHLNKKQNIKTILKQLCKENEITFKEAKRLLKEPLEELYLNRVFH